MTAYYAGFWRRMGAAAIDLILGVLFAAVVFSWFPESFWDDHPEAAGIVVLAYLSVWFNYFAFAEWRWGQTFGKVATRIKVVSEDGKPLTWGQTSLRNLLRLVDLIVIGFLLIGLADTRQRLGDRAGRTVVVPVPPKPGALVGAAVPPPPGGSTPPRPPEPAQRAPGPAAALASAPPPDPDTIVPVSPAPGSGPAPAGPGTAMPEVTWNLGQTIGWFFGGLFLAVLAPLLVVPFDPDLESTWGLLVAQGLFGLALMGVAVGVASGWSLARLREALGRLGLRRFKPSALGWMLLAMFGYYVFAAIFASLLLQPEQEDISRDLGLCNENVLVVLGAILLIAVLAPISEELFFRGFLFAGLRKRFSLWPAIIVSGLLFGLVHAPTGLTTVPLLAVLGGLLAWFYAWTGSLWPSVIMHLINNSLALSVAGAEQCVVPVPFL